MLLRLRQKLLPLPRLFKALHSGCLYCGLTDLVLATRREKLLAEVVTRAHHLWRVASWAWSLELGTRLNLSTGVLGSWVDSGLSAVAAVDAVTILSILVTIFGGVLFEKVLLWLTRTRP